MKQFIDNLISRLEEEPTYNVAAGEDYIIQGNALPKSRVIEIVKQFAEEYKGGWIPCSEKMPEEPEENPELDYKPLELYLVSIPGTKYPFRAFWNGKFFTDGWDKVDAVAWMPLPEPYQKEGE